MSAWWDDLPVDSVVLLVGAYVYERNGDGWFTPGRNVLYDRLPGKVRSEHVTVIYVPVTDAEPPVGSVIQCSEGDLWLHRIKSIARDGKAWWNLQFGRGDWCKSWPSLQPGARILRWGE